jgi:hypothetical protein
MKKSFSVHAAESARVLTPLFCSLLLSLTSCVHEEASDHVADPAAAQQAPGQVADDVSLKEDRSRLDDLRKEIPENLRRQNDELAGIFELMAKSDQEPSEIRERFNTVLRKRREKMDQELRQKREDFSKKDQRGHDAFLKAQNQERERFAHETHTADQRKHFFDQQDERRRSYFAKSADLHKIFEDEIADRRKDFEDYVREKTNFFNTEYRNFSARYTERRKAESLKKETEERARESGRASETTGRAGAESAGRLGAPSSRSSDPLQEFREAPKPKVIPLGPGDQSGE